MKFCKKLVSAICVIAMCLSCLLPAASLAESRAEVPEGYDFYVYFDVEAFTMGWGFLVEPMAVPAREGENLATVTLRALDMAGKQYSYSGSPETGMYLRGIECANTQPNIPQYIMDQFAVYPAWAEENLGEPYGSWTGNYTDDGLLCEMEYSSFAGWMFAVNGYAASVGCDGVTVVENTVYSWMFTVYGWGMDCGLNDGWGMFPDFDNPASITWRPRVLRGYANYASDPAFVAKMAEGGQAHAEYVAFMNAVTDLSSSQEAIDSAFAALEEALYDFYVYIDFEAFTLGWGFIVEPMKVPAYEGENLASVTLRALEMANNAPVYSGSVDSGFYLMGIECSYTEPNIPQYIMDQFDIYPAWAEENMGMSFGQWTGARTLEGMLYELDFSDFAGWMFSVNDVAGAVGADGITVNEGDVCRWMFSVYGWGMDCGLNDGWGMFPEFDNPAEGVLRSDVIKGYVELAENEEYAAMMAEGGSAHDEYVAFMNTVSNIAASQNEIDAAYAALVAALNGAINVMGDADCNGSADFSDISFVYSMLIGLTELTDQGFINADLDGDGSIGFSDVSDLYSYIIGVVG